MEGIRITPESEEGDKVTSEGVVSGAVWVYEGGLWGRTGGRERRERSGRGGGLGIYKVSRDTWLLVSCLFGLEDVGETGFVSGRLTCCVSFDGRSYGSVGTATPHSYLSAQKPRTAGSDFTSDQLMLRIRSFWSDLTSKFSFRRRGIENQTTVVARW